jgi:hypothetical protein
VAMAALANGMRRVTPRWTGKAEGKSPALLAKLVRQRAQKRRYMRRWRAVPENRARERQAGRKSLATRRSRMSLMRLDPGNAVVAKPGCSYCGNPTVKVLKRLVAIESGYRMIRVAYCGFC